MMERIKPDFSPLDKILQQMGAKIPPSELVEGLSTPTGMEIPQWDIEDIDGVLGYIDPDTGEAHQTTIYIRDHRYFRRPRDILIGGGNKIHLVECKALRKMFASGRKHRYRISIAKVHIRTIDTRQASGVPHPLDVCKLCLKQYEHTKNLSWWERQKLAGNFDFSVLFFRHEEAFKGFRPEGDPSEGYPPNWQEISSRYRAQANWHCECCGLDLNGCRRLLHTHHIDGNKSNCDDDNLKALCLLCHAKQPWHSLAVKISEAKRQTIFQLRREQNLPKHCLNCQPQQALL